MTIKERKLVTFPAHLCDEARQLGLANLSGFLSEALAAWIAAEHARRSAESWASDPRPYGDDDVDWATEYGITSERIATVDTAIAALRFGRSSPTSRETRRVVDRAAR